MYILPVLIFMSPLRELLSLVPVEGFRKPSQGLSDSLNPWLRGPTEMPRLAKQSLSNFENFYVPKSDPGMLQKSRFWFLHA